jgi:hypothetical protein
MKLRQQKIEMTDQSEREEAEIVRHLAREAGEAEPAPSNTYFATLIARTNERLDYVTSGKALSISWLARVAIPGVVAILFFFIGLHYYNPETGGGSHSLVEEMKTLSSADLDSLIVESASENSLPNADLHSDLFQVSNEQLAEFYITSESPLAVLELLPEQQQKEVAAILESRSINL